MIKRDEIDDSESCFNKAGDGERLFVMLARDPAAPVAIRAWVAERVRLGRNHAADEQIREALACADLMESERAGIEASRQQVLRWTADRIAISKLDDLHDPVPRREEVLTWGAFAGLFAEPRIAACALGSCTRSACAYKRGTCWSPGLFMKEWEVGAPAGSARRGRAYAVSALVFDVDGATDDQIDEIRGRLAAHRHLIHSTHADRPDCRHVRVIVALSRTIPRIDWGAFWSTARRRLVPIADGGCADPDRVYFMPSVPEGAGYFIQVNEGLPLDVDAFAEVSVPSPALTTAEVSP